MKKNISLFLAIVNLLALFCMPVQAADVDVSQYGSATYTTAYYVPSGSGDSSIACVQSGDGTETGGYVLTYSKASSATSVPADTLITGAGGGLGNVKIANDDYGAKTFHSRYTFVESSSPILLQFQHKNSSNAVTLKDTFTMTNEGVSFGSAYVASTAPYDVNIFQNVYTGETVIYVNDTVLIDQRGTGETLIADGATYWHKLNFITTQDDSAFGLVLKNIRHMVYTTDVTLSDVVGYVMNDSGSGDEVDPPVEPEEPEIVYEEGIKDLSDYTLNGYNNKQLNNSWANVTLSDVTDENGVITTTASYSGDLASGKRIASFQPWAEYQGIGSNASDHNIFQFGFTVNEITSPVYLEYNYSRDGGAKKTLISFSDSKVVAGGSMNGDTFIEVKAPYTINIFMNIKTYRGMIYVNDQLLYQGNLNNSSADKKWREVRVISLENSKDIKLVTTKANSSIFNSDVAFTNVVDYVLNREDAVNTNWIWKIDGFNLNMGKMQGAVDGVTNVTGNNEDGYVLQPDSINESHYGFARYFLAQESGTALAKSDNDKVLWQSFEYNPTVLTSGQIFEIRGNNAYQTLMRAVPATETEPAYLETTSGGKVCNLDESKFYKIDLIVNNKDYEYYIVVDGKVAAHDIIWDSRQPLWNTVFSSYTTDEKMTIKNLETTVYDDTVTMADVLKKVSTSVYTDISDVVYDDSVKELTVTATLVGDNTLFNEADLIYVAYAADGALVALDIATAYSEDVNATEFGRAYPYGFLDISDVAEGEALTIKAFLWDGIGGVTPISNVGTYEYTLPTTTPAE